MVVCGLNGHAYESWKAEGNTQDVWVRDFLAKDFPDCRTMIYGYNTNLQHNSFHTLEDYTGNFLEELKKARKSDKVSFSGQGYRINSQTRQSHKYGTCIDNLTFTLQERPIIFIGHSFGGIVIAQVRAQILI